MKLEELKTVEQLSQFLDGTQAVIFKLNTKNEKLGFSSATERKINNLEVVFYHF